MFTIGSNYMIDKANPTEAATKQISDAEVRSAAALSMCIFKGSIGTSIRFMGTRPS